MTQLPPIPRSRRNLNDLDSLIDASIGKSDTYGAAPSAAETAKPYPEAGTSTKETTPSPDGSEQVDAPSPSLLNNAPASEEPKSERFRISIDASVIMATKMVAVQQKTSPSEIVERALRRYLNLAAN
ncbi:hypothetical protein RHSP_41139 (plasmid) [Rhizobium freirei PRF 81]|uniref:Uncharacterized protein n=1 Tax=Rhizobium freirei PRF 81 TaxID=363754 RepID=N6UY47_9HYPH|nr:hypothetical protein [Rhizobium freirei]ENN83802.1 hypothetical protein RHSP_41139 [Rhizobium freirei PRF 81]